MSPRREFALFMFSLAAMLAAFLSPALFLGRVLSSGDVVRASASFAAGAADYEPLNRLLMDPVLQFQPWLEFNRRELRAGRLPLWNPYAGCGAPHLANGQSAVFDPFHLIAYLGPLPDAHAWMAFARLWVAGVGAYLLARRWGMNAWGRWFAGLAFPLCGFLIVWLLYPVTSSAVWLPWIMLAADAVLGRPSARAVVALALAVAASIFGGHIQTTAHVLILVSLYIIWRAARRDASLRAAFSSVTGVALGVAVGAIQILPLAAYLSRSPVWHDRDVDRPSPLAVSRPRLLDAANTAFPYLYGSQRRGHPNFARPLGVHNLNESAGGFAGLATLVLLAPLAWQARRTDSRVTFLAAIALTAALVAFEVPPFVNATRLIPILNVIDHRRLTLWIAFALVMLGGFGIDRVAQGPPIPFKESRIARVCIWIGASMFVAGAIAIVAARPWLLSKALAHYQATDITTDAATLAGRQVDNATHFLPIYYALCAAHLLIIGTIAKNWRVQRVAPSRAAALFLALTVADLFAFGFGLNPAIGPADDRPVPPIIARLQTDAPLPYRVVGVGSELPPNLLMRYGIADCRNYDSVELRSALDWLEMMYEPESGRAARTSRRTITWEGVARACARLRAASVRFAVGASPPPTNLFPTAERIGDVWMVDLEPDAPRFTQPTPGEIRIDASANPGDRVIVPVAFDPGWHAEIDGRPVRVEPHQGALLAIAPGSARGLIRMNYDPIEVRAGLCVTLTALGLMGLLSLQDAWRRVVRKNDPGAWMPESASDRIGTVIPPFFDRIRRLSTEGRDTDGPLHV